MPFFVEIILPLPLPRTFTYSLSEDNYTFIKPGMRVLVPFGKNKTYTGLVLKTHQLVPTLYEAKEIHQIIDTEPIVTTNQLQHWQWIANYYMCAIGEVYRGAMPSGLILESETIISKIEEAPNKADLSDDEYLILEALQQQPNLSIFEIASIVNKKNVFPIITAMMEDKLLAIKEEFSEKYKPKLVRYIRLHATYDTNEGVAILLNILKNAPKQKDIVLHYFQLMATEKKPVALKKLLDSANVSSAIIKPLLDKSIFEDYYIQHNRVDFKGVASTKELVLSADQQKAFLEITAEFATKKVCLLHGVTASGKTEIYIKIIEEYLLLGQQVLYLLPEIALTTQLVSRLRAHFGNKVLVYHSKYTNNERVEVWKQVLGTLPTDEKEIQKSQIIIGARSALFLPFQNLGFIIIDEEHEQTFKQIDPAPRYHARDAAIVLASFGHTKVLLGSATPSIESFYNAQIGKYGLVQNFKRYSNLSLPIISLVDLKDSYFRKKMNGHFSQELLEKMTEALQKKEQIILFQNRRGFSPILECISCGHVPQCQLCDVSLTYHKHKNQLRCHYCGYAISKPTHCHSCSSVDLSTKGFGTEQVQQELFEIFPDAVIGRMDQDTTRGKFGFEKILESFKNQEIDILVGTQMLAKGLDFENVSLVGIMNADNLLFQPDFRAFERSFQMMTQVAGRAGRANKQGNVVIQTYNPNHNTIQQVANGDYENMYKEQLYDRKIYYYPPFFRIIKLTLKHRDFEKLKEAAIWLHQLLVHHLQMPVLGPEEPAINRIRNEYLKTILIKMPPTISVSATKNSIKKILNSFEAVPNFRAIKVVVNVDF